MARKTNPSNPSKEGSAKRPSVKLGEPFDALQPPLIDEIPVFDEPDPSVEPGDPNARSLIDELSRREVEELNRALDETKGVAESVVMTVRLSPREYERLNRFAAEHGMTHQLLMQEALFEYIDKRTD